MGDTHSVPLSRLATLRLLAVAAAESERVFFTHHALQRMRGRRITRTQVLRAFRQAHVTEGPSRDMRGNWTCRIEARVEGRPLGVAVAFEREDNVIVITAFWMD